MPGAPATSPGTALACGTGFDAGRQSVSGELNSGAVVYFAIRAVASASVGWLRSGTSAAGTAVCAASGEGGSEARSAQASSGVARAESDRRMQGSPEDGRAAMGSDGVPSNAG